MTEDEREEFARHIRRMSIYKSQGIPLSPLELSFLKTAEHIAVLNKRNFNLANERQRLENGIDQVIKKAKREAWSEGYRRGLNVHYDDGEDLGNPYDETKVDGE